MKGRRLLLSDDTAQVPHSLLVAMHVCVCVCTCVYVHVYIYNVAGAHFGFFW